MVRCPNCGQKTSGDDCQWCNYPILRGRSRKRREAEKQARKEAKIAAGEKAKQEAEEAMKAKEAEKQARKEAEIAAGEKAKQEAEKARKAEEAEKQVREEAEEYLKQVESTCDELEAGKIETKEAIQKLKDIVERIPK